MIHFVFRTDNTQNGKFYIGVHSTININDNYLGSGKHLNRAIKKYGRQHFARTILKVCETRDEALKFEAKLVDHTNPKSYNLCKGGVVHLHDLNIQRMVKLLLRVMLEHINKS